MTSPDDPLYQRAKTAWHELLGLDATSRLTRLKDLDKTDPALAARVADLLEATVQDTRPNTPDEPALPAGYSNATRIAVGGMGVVYRAERDLGGVPQAVAIKLLRHAAFASPVEHARFDAERRILARLDHPNIARLLDAGTDAAGRAFLAMEFVDGERIDRYCEREAKGLRDRIRLMAKVCRAVDAAHRQLVVHRDLKPTNVLVDRHGEPKLLDFGIAKLLAGHADGEEALQTGTGETVLTLRYAAPEQIRNDPAAPATDVYALGVMLFELLTGASPYGETTSQPLRLPERICHVDVVAPSTLGGAQTRALRGDLDAIVLRCLRKDPALRYAGADRLADDLDAWLEGRPVAARRGSRGYLVARWLARHRLAVAAVAVVVLLTAAFVLRLGQELRTSELERLRAETAVARAQATTQFLIGMFKDAHPDQANGRSFSIREALDRGTARIATEMADAPAERAALLSEIADIYSELADGPQAEASASAASLAAGEAGDAALQRRAMLAMAYAQQVAGKPDEAMVTATALRTQSLAAGDARSARSALIRLADLLSDRGDKAEAVALYDQIDAELLAQLRIDSPAAALRLVVSPASRAALEGLAWNRHNRCTALADLGRSEEALPVCIGARDLKARLWPAEHPVHVSTLSTLSSVYGNLGDEKAALATNENVASLMEKIYGPEHPKLAIVLLNLAVDLSSVGRDDDAERLLDRAIAIFAKPGKSGRGYFMARNNRANIFRRRGEHARALEEHLDILALRRAAFGEVHQDVAQSEMNVANQLSSLKRDAQAIDHARRAVDIYERAGSASAADARLARMNLANKLYTAGRIDAAVAEAQTAYDQEMADSEAPQRRGFFEFALAQPLWDQGSDRVRATQLARSAYRHLQAEPAFAEQAGAVKQWMQEQGLEPES